MEEIKPTPLVRGAEIIARTLCELGVRIVFCYPGGANLEILDALSRVDITLIRTEHEQGAAFAAQGYARASGLLGVCLATSGPGATNLVTGIADANSDSIPVLALTGNVATRWLGKNAFQEVDIVSIVRPITKYAKQVRAVEDIAPALRDAMATALEGRPGPVLLDFPKDLQQGLTPAIATDGVGSVGPTATRRSAPELTSDALSQIAQLITGSVRPVIYAGGGIIASGTSAELIRFAEALDCPVVLTLMGLGAIGSAHPLFLGPIGMHGAHCANVAVNEADLVLALGVRFDDRVIGDPAAFAAAGRIIHIDVDANELGKNKSIALGCCADLRHALPQLLSVARRLPTAPWRQYLSEVAHERPLSPMPARRGLSGSQAIGLLAERLPADAIITTGVGQHQMWAMQHLPRAAPRRFLSSSGFGTMGFGLPSAIGAKCAVPEATVIDIDGDGSLNMTINELSTCRRHRIGVKIFVVNNQWLGMVRQWQDMIYAGNRVASSLEDPISDVRPTGENAPYPDFLAIASGYRIAAERVESEAEFQAGLARFLADPNESYLLDVMVERESDVLPMIPAGKTYRDVIFESRNAKVLDT